MAGDPPPLPMSIILRDLAAHVFAATRGSIEQTIERLRTLLGQVEAGQVDFLFQAVRSRIDLEFVAELGGIATPARRPRR